MVGSGLIKRTWRRVTGVAAHGWGPARAAGLRGECPPASAFGECLLLYFAPKACRPRRDAGSQACRKAKLPPFALGRCRAIRKPGSSVLGCDIQEEASDAGQDRGQCASKGTPPPPQARSGTRRDWNRG